MWNYIRLNVLKEAINEMGIHEVDRICNVCLALRSLFKVSELSAVHSDITELYYYNYDVPLFSAICDYLRGGNKFMYTIKPELSDQQLETLKIAIQTTLSLIKHGDHSYELPHGIKHKIIEELSKDYNIANDRFFKFYKELFEDKSYTHEHEPKTGKPYDMIAEICNLSDGKDSQLFMKIILLIRGELSDTLNY